MYYMKKDWFNGKIKEEYVNWMKCTIIMVPSVCFLMGTILLLMTFFEKNITPTIRICFYVLAAFFYLFTFLYSFIALKVIRSYPKHKRIAHTLIKKFVFVDYEEDLLSSLKDIHPTPERVYETIIHHIFSIEMKAYLREHQDELSIMQWGTLVIEFCEGRDNKVRIFEALRDFVTSEYEKKLFDIALKDLKKYGDIAERTIAFYLKNDPREENKPDIPFMEFIELPILFEFGDVVQFYKNQEDYYLVGMKPSVTDTLDISDYSYLCYKINQPIRNEEDLFQKHAHLDACNINLVKADEIPEKIKINIPGALELLKEFYSKNFKNKS